MCPAAPGRSRAIDVTDLVFRERARFRPFAVVAPGFVQAGAGAVGLCDTVTRSTASPQAPFAAVEVDLVGGVAGTLVAGLTTDDGDGVLATWDAAAGRVAIEVTVAGRAKVVRRAKADLTGVGTFAFALCESQVTVLVRRAGVWQALLTERAKVAKRLDLRDPGTLARHTYTWGVRDGQAEIGDVRAGLFGMTGLRDPHLVQHADGTPYERDGRLFLTWTCAGLGFFPQAHWGVFAFDPEDPTTMEQVAQVYARRDGLLLGDHAGQLVRDGDDWLVVHSSWGDFTPKRGVHLRHARTTDDLLSGVHVLDTERTALPTDQSAWDPVMTRVDGRWHLGFVESPSQAPFRFHPALAATDATSPFDGLHLVAAARDLRQTEGPVLVRVDGTTSLLASDGHARDFPVFDLDLRRRGTLRSPYPTNIPHPQLVPRADGSWLMLTFDGTAFAKPVVGYGGHGDVVVMATA